MTRRGKRRSGAPREISEREARLYQSDRWATTIGRIGVEVARWAGIGYCAYQGSLALIAWSGEATIADVTMDLSATGPFGTAVVLGLLVGAAGVWYGKKQAQLRREIIQHFESRVRELESMIDPRRSSSGLTTSGDTPAGEERP